MLRDCVNFFFLVQYKMNTIIILVCIATLAYFLFLKPKTSIVGTWAIRGPSGLSFWYFAPDKTIRFFSDQRDNVFSENPSTANYTVSGSQVHILMSPDSLPLTGRLELNGKFIVGRDRDNRSNPLAFIDEGREKQGMLKISDNLLAPKQMAELVYTGAIAGIITNDQLVALDRAARPLLQ